MSLSKTDDRGGLSAKLLSILYESRWRGDISQSEYYVLQRYVGGLPEAKGRGAKPEWAKKQLGTMRKLAR